MPSKIDLMRWILALQNSTVGLGDKNILTKISRKIRSAIFSPFGDFSVKNRENLPKISKNRQLT